MLRAAASLVACWAVAAALPDHEAAQAKPPARAIVQTAERAVSDDSAEVVRARWMAALRTDSMSRVARLGLGSLARLEYDFPGAEGHFRHILATSRTTDEYTVQARIGLYRVALAEGNWLRADSLLTIAIADARRISDRGGEIERATHDHSSLGRLASRRSDELQFLGRLGEAKAALRMVLEKAEISRNRERFGFAYAGLGMLALRMNDLNTATEYFERAAALYDSLGQMNGARIAQGNQAWVLSMGDDIPAARITYEEFLKVAQETGRLEDEVISRQQLARLSMREANWADARAHLDSAETAAARKGRGGEARGDLAYDRARVALGRGDLAAAQRMFTAFLATLEPDRRLHRHLTRMRIAEIQALRGDLAAAERQITSAGEELETWRALLGGDELRRFAFAATAAGGLLLLGAGYLALRRRDRSSERGPGRGVMATTHQR